MKYYIRHFLFVLIGLVIFIPSHAQTFNWVKGGGTSITLGTSTYSVEATYKMCTDPHGNTYALSVVGNGTVSADTFSHSATGISQNILFTSYNCSGQMRFAKLISSVSPTQQGIVADSFGNVYLAMDLPHSSLDPGILRLGYDTTITAFTYSNQALVKYDTSGHLQWIRFVGNNTSSSFGGTCCSDNNLVLDVDQNPHLIINNYAGIVFRPGDTSKYGATDLRYDPAGNLLTVKHLNLDTTLMVVGVIIDPSSNKLYAYGNRRGAFYSLTPYKFLAALDTNRNKIWSDTLINPSSSYGFTGVAADGKGNLYVSAQGYGAMTIYRNDTARNVLSTSLAALSNFVMKTDTAGSVLWMTTFSAASLGGLINLVLDPNKRKLALVGSLAGKIKCDIDSITSYPGEADNPIFAVLDTAGYVHELQQLHAPGSNTWANISSFDRVGNLYAGGRMTSSIWGGTITPYTSVGGDSDFFITKYGVDCNCASMPVADFTAVPTGSHTYTFTYTGTTTPAIDSIRWYFGDGTTSTATNPIHNFVASGKLTVRCWVYTSCGRDLKAIKIDLPCTYPGGASFTHSGVSTIAFNYTGSTTDIDSIRWSFGDGGTSPLANPTHPYAAVGTYMACVKVYSWCGVDSFCTTITVPCVSAPIVAFSSIGTGATRNFNYTGSATGVTSISWDYGDGSSLGSGTITSHTYASTGVYTVCVTATSPCGSNVICTTVNVTCLSAPVPSFNKSGSMATHIFGYTGTLAGVDSIGWDFGDGGHAAGTTPSHTYATTGIFTVCVTAHSQCGNIGWCDTVNIPCLAAPSATFISTGTVHDSTRNFSYTSSMTGVDSVRWDFGDGNGYTGTSVTHSYSDTGSYVVCIIAYSQCGNDTVCSTVVYHFPLDVSSSTAGNILVYPNPASDQLVVENAAGSEMRICDVVGREVYRAAINDNMQVVDVSGLESGVYVVMFSNEVGVKVVRVVKR